MIRKLLLLAGLLPWAPTFIQAQSLDVSFNTTGYYQTLGGWQHSGSAAQVLVQPDGKIVTVGMALDGNYTVLPEVVRMLPGGTPDPSFGVNGHGWLTGFTFLINPLDACLQTDGKIVVTGMAQPGTESQGFIARFLSNGIPDLSFSQDGIEFYAPEIANVFFKRLIIQPDGKYVVGGMITDSYHATNLIARFLPDGTPDSTFGITQPGFTYGNYLTEFSGMYDMAMQSDGKILLTGDHYSGTGVNSVLVERYTGNGNVDSSFGVNGSANHFVSSNSDNMGQAIVVNSDGDIYVSGYVVNFPPGLGFGVGDGIYLRLDSIGNLNPAFAGVGYTTISMGGMTDVPVRLLQQPDGKLISVGYTDDHPYTGGWYAPDFDYGLCRINPDGSLDSAFGNNGVFIQAFSVGNDLPKGMALQADGKILVAGENSLSIYTQLSVARFGFNSATGLQEDLNAGTMVVYPNPADNIVRIALKDNEVPSRVVVMDQAGKCVLEQHHCAAVNVSSLNDGAYLLQVFSEGSSSVRKLMIVH